MNEHRFSIQPGVIDILQEQLVLPSANLQRCYDQISSYHLPGNQNIAGTQLTHLREPFRSLMEAHTSRTTMAIDVPVLITQKSARPVLMICAMDALPPVPTSSFWQGRAVNHSFDVGLGVPFSLVDDWSIPRGSLFSNLAFFKELLEHFDLYITDIYKLFFRVQTGATFITSNSIQEYTQLANPLGENVHAAILKAEIEHVQPRLIITLGSAARQAMAKLIQQTQTLRQWDAELQMYQWNEHIPWIASPHISNAANGTKKLLLQHPRYAGIDGVYANQRLAKILLHEIKLNQFL